MVAEEKKSNWGVVSFVSAETDTAPTQCGEHWEPRDETFTHGPISY